MIKKLFYLGFIPTIFFTSRIKEESFKEVNMSDGSTMSELISFATASELHAYVEDLKDGMSVQTKSTPKFMSLWDYQQKEFIA